MNYIQLLDIRDRLPGHVALFLVATQVVYSIERFVASGDVAQENWLVWIGRTSRFLMSFELPRPGTA